MKVPQNLDMMEEQQTMWKLWVISNTSTVSEEANINSIAVFSGVFWAPSLSERYVVIATNIDPQTPHSPSQAKGGVREVATSTNLRGQALHTEVGEPASLQTIPVG